MGRRIILFTLALLLAVGGTGAVLVYVSKADSRALANEKPVTVLTAAHDIAAGTSVADAQKKGWFTTTQIPRKTEPAGALISATALAGQFALTTVYSGQIVMPSLFGTKAPVVTGLALTPGSIAVTVEADAPMRVGSFLTAGSEVAVFDTFNSATFDTAPWTPSGDGITDDFKYDRATRLLLDRVKVLAIGASTSGSSDSPAGAAAAGTVDPASLVTIEVTQDQAEKLILGEQTGHLYLALLDDQSKVAASGGVDNRTLFGGK